MDCLLTRRQLLAIAQAIVTLRAVSHGLGRMPEDLSQSAALVAAKVSDPFVHVGVRRNLTHDAAALRERRTVCGHGLRKQARRCSVPPSAVKVTDASSIHKHHRRSFSCVLRCIGPPRRHTTTAFSAVAGHAGGSE